MARCGCASDRCSCTVVAGDGVVVSGGGTRSNPYVVQAVAAGSGAEVPATARFSGEITMFGGITAPTGWLLCDGSAINRAVYPDLFAAIGSAYGAGDGSTTFNLPNLSGKFPIGSSGTYPRGQSGGATVKTAVSSPVTLTTNHLPSHAHDMWHDHGPATTSNGGDHFHTTFIEWGTNTPTNGTVVRITDIDNLTGGSGTNGEASTRNAGTHAHTFDVPAYGGATGGSGAGQSFTVSTNVDTTPPYQAVNYIIKI